VDCKTVGMFYEEIFSLLQVVEGTKTKMKLFLGLGVPESDRGVETIVFR
jgi:hypothetical protein